MRHLGLLLPLALAACSGGSEGPTSTSTGSGDTSSGTTTSSGSGGGMPDGGPVGGDRPVEIHVPPSYSQATPVPLVLMLHGYSASADLEEAYLNITAESDKRGFIYARANGTLDAQSQRFWNATEACCNFNASTVDDSGYLSAVIKDIQARFSIDPKRVYLFGHSNGGFMSYRMACDHADQIAAFVSLAGAMFNDPSECKHSEPVAVLEVHGTADMTIAYDGDNILGNAFPSAQTSVADWAGFDGCGNPPDTSAPPMDLEASLPGAETTVTSYNKGCKPGGYAELWTIAGGSHIPSFTSAFVPSAIDFLYAHPKP